MAGRNKVFKDEVALADAMKVFWQFGYEGSSMSKLLRAMGLNKGSLYHTFGSKKELFLRVIEQYSESLEEHIEGQLSNSENTIDGIQGIFYNLIETDEIEKINQGCLLVNTIGELSFLEPSLKDIAAHKLRCIEEIFLKHLNVARQKKLLKADTPCEQIAKHLITLYSGIQINRRLYPYQDGLSFVMQSNLQLLDQYILKDSH